MEKKENTSQTTDYSGFLDLVSSLSLYPTASLHEYEKTSKTVKDFLEKEDLRSTENLKVG